MATVVCLGAAGTVTGSNYLIETARGRRFLVDCGMFQGSKRIETRNWLEWDFDPSQIETLILTHAHIDHSGRIPKLVKDGFRGKIITSRATADLCEIMLRDSAHVQEMDAEWQTRKNRRKGKKEIQPLYTMTDAEECLSYLSPVEEDTVITLDDEVRLRLRDAGHILGSSIVELWLAEEDSEIKIVFSGDLGRENQLIVKDPADIGHADYLFVESTYGDRLHKTFEDSKQELLDAINYALSNGEKVIIPAFALERTQEILYLLGEFSRDSLLPDIPIYLDSPLAIKTTEIFRSHKDYYDREARAIVNEGFDPFDMPNLHFTAATEESMAINQRSGSAIIIAASGMCTAGRIKHHLKHNLWRPGASVIIVGYQAAGTTGRQIVDGAGHVRIFGENVAVKAKVFTIGGFSAHADQTGLLQWVGNFVNESQPRVFVIHGEKTASETLAEEITRRYKLDARPPRWREALNLRPRKEVAVEKEGVDTAADIDAAVADTIAAMEKELARLKTALREKQHAGTLTEGDIEQLRAVREDIETIAEDRAG